jgi:hypothetical protein
MLLPDNIHPENTLYYKSAYIVRIVQKKEFENLYDLYKVVMSKVEMTFPVFILCLDWLYLIDLVEIDENGRIKLCS